MIARFARLGALFVLLAVLLPGSLARASSLGFGLRGGISDQPDQLLVGGHIRITGLIPAAPAIWFEPNATVGIGDDLTTIQISGDFKYALPVGQLQLYPIVGLSYIHYSLDDDRCRGDCSDGQAGLHLGFGLLYGQVGADLVLDVTDDLPNLRLMVHFTF